MCNCALLIDNSANKIKAAGIDEKLLQHNEDAKVDLSSITCATLNMIVGA